MSVFINNINTYLGERKIKQNYVSLVTGWTASKVSRILSEKTSINDDDKQILAEALGYDVSFFMQADNDMRLKPKMNSQLAFFAGNISNEEKKTATSLVDMFRFYDSIVNLEL